MTQKEKVSRAMKMSWQLQYTKRYSRSKALQQAWAILNNEDVAVLHLVRKLNRDKPVNWKDLKQFSLFNQ